MSPAPGLWADLRAALRGTNADYTQIPLKRAVFLLAIPMMLELVLESTFAVVDIFFVAKLGPSAVATVGLTETYLFLLYSVAMGLSMAVTAIVARRVGEHRGDEAALSAVQAILLAVLISLPVTIAGIVWAQDLRGWRPWSWNSLPLIPARAGAGSERTTSPLRSPPSRG